MTERIEKSMKRAYKNKATKYLLVRVDYEKGWGIFAEGVAGLLEEGLKSRRKSAKEEKQEIKRDELSYADLGIDVTEMNDVIQLATLKALMEKG